MYIHSALRAKRMSSIYDVCVYYVRLYVYIVRNERKEQVLRMTNVYTKCVHVCTHCATR